MTTTSGTAGTRELDRTASQAESTAKLVCWLSVSVFGAGCVTVELQSPKVWCDLPILLDCLIFVRHYALRLLKKP